MEKVYLHAVMELLKTGSDIEIVLGNLRTVMAARGHSKALPAVLHALVRSFEQGSTAGAPVVTVARDTDVAILVTEIKAALATLGATNTTFSTTVDDTIIGGLIATYNHRQIDQSYRSKLVALYQSVTN